MTRAEHLKALMFNISVEKLADLLGSDSDFCGKQCPYRHEDSCIGKCKQGRIDWLNQEEVAKSKCDSCGEEYELIAEGLKELKEKKEKCQWIKYDYRTVCPKEHDIDNPYWRIPENRKDVLKYCPYCGKEIDYR